MGGVEGNTGEKARIKGHLMVTIETKYSRNVLKYMDM